MTKYIHILNFKAEDVTEEEAREIGIRLIVNNIKHTSGFVMVSVTDEPIDTKGKYELKLAYETEVTDGTPE